MVVDDTKADQVRSNLLLRISSSGSLAGRLQRLSISARGLNFAT
jgi:hypothetical protein